MKAALYRRTLLVFCVLFFLATACSLPAATPGIPNTSPTRAAQTIEAMMTKIAGESTTATPASPGNPAPAATDTTAPPDPTLRPSSTPLPTATAIILPTATATTICNQADFVSDISIPDGSVVPAGTQFVKTWRIKNTGSCAWTNDYTVVFDSGDAMSAPASQRLDTTVDPGKTVDISVIFVAPGSAGKYKSNWKLRSTSGVVFGLGASGKGKFYADIEVVSQSTNSGAGYDFTANYCIAEWTGNAKTLSCQGKDGSTDGFVLYLTKPTLESGYQDDEPGLITNPPRANDGVIRGKYPAYTVKSGDHFESIVGCEYKAKACDVIFALDYQIGDGSITNLASWHEAYEGAYSGANVDLSNLAGKKVKFILTVRANGSSDNDRALWLLPRIVNH